LAASDSDSLLLALFQQLQGLERQMAAQYEQALRSEQCQRDMMMMMQMFVGLYREERELIRAELDGIFQLSREIEGVQKELARYSSAALGQIAQKVQATVPAAATAIEHEPARVPATEAKGSRSLPRLVAASPSEAGVATPPADAQAPSEDAGH